jgi:hypothetical protein
MHSRAVFPRADLAVDQGEYRRLSGSAVSTIEETEYPPLARFVRALSQARSD